MKSLIYLIILQIFIFEEQPSQNKDLQQKDQKDQQQIEKIKDLNNQDLFQKFISQRQKFRKTVQNQDNNQKSEKISNIEEVIEVNKKIEIDKPYKIEKSAYLEITEELTKENLLVICQNHQLLKIILIGTKQGEEEEKQIFEETLVFYDATKTFYIPIHKEHLQKSIGGKIQILNEKFKNQDEYKEDDTNKYLLIRQYDYLNMDLFSTVELALNFTNQINIKISTKNRNQQDNRYAFYAQTDFSLRKLKNDQKFQILINHNTDFPSKIEKSDIDTNQLIDNFIISTINQNQEKNMFCESDDCFYYVTLIVNDIYSVAFNVQSQKTILETQSMTFVEYENEIKKDEKLLLKQELDLKTFAGLKITYESIGDDSFYLVKQDNENSEPIDDFLIDNKKHNVMQYISQQYFESINQSLKFLFFEFQMYDENNTGGFKFIQQKIYHNMKTFQKETELTQVFLMKQEHVTFSIPLHNYNQQNFFWNLQTNVENGEFDIVVFICHDFNCYLDPVDIDEAKIQKKLINLNKNSQNDDKYYFHNTSGQKNNNFEPSLLLQFSCEEQNDIQDELSSNCQVLIYLEGKQNKNKIEFKIQGEVESRLVKLNQGKNVKISENDEILFQIPIENYILNDNKFFNLKAVCLTGSNEIYFSNSNNDLDKSSNDGMIVFDRQHNSSFDIIEKQLSQDLIDMGQNFLYVKIKAKSYTIMDLFFNVSNSPLLNYEDIQPDILYHRSFNHDQVQKTEETITYQQNFRFELQNEEVETTQIVLTSPFIQIKICVKLDIDIIEKSECDFSTEKMILEIPKEILNTKKKIAIQVSKKFNLLEQEVQNQMDFTITIRNYKKEKDSNTQLELFQPGTVYTHIIKPLEKIDFSLDFNMISFYGIISLTSFNPAIQATVYVINKDKNDSKIIGKLDSRNFAITFYYQDFIDVLENFSQNKNFIVKIVNNDKVKSSRFSLTYTYDNHPIQLTEGSGIYFPKNMKLLFIYKNLNSQIFNLNIRTENTKFESFMKLNEKDPNDYNILERLDETNFDYKSDLNNECEISIPTEFIMNKYFYSVDILYSPKKDYKLPNEGVSIVSLENRAIISINTKLKELFPFESYYDHGIKGEINYYFFIVDEVQDSIILSLNMISGEADLYMNKGFQTLPTKNSYWKKSNKYKGEEIEISPSMFKDQNEMVGIYTIGIYSREQSHYSLIFAPDFGKIYHLQFQKILNINMKAKEYYYIYYHISTESYKTYLYSNQSDVSISALKFQEEDGLDFLKLISEDKNYNQNFVYYKNTPPRRNLIITDIKDSYRIVVRLLSDVDTEFIFAYYDQNKFLEVSSEKKFFFKLEKDQQQIFKFSMDERYDKINFDIKAKYGSVYFKLNDKDDWSMEVEKYVDSSQQVQATEFRDKNDKGELILFKNIYVKIKALKDSYISFMLKPEEKFKVIQPLEPELVQIKKNKESFYYMEITQAIKNLQEMHFELKISKQNQQFLPEFYYFPFTNVSLDKNIDFLPMPIIDYIKDDKNQFLTIIVRPKIKTGFYIVKFPKFDLEQVVKLTLNINNEKLLQLNGFTQEFFNPYNFKIRQYSLYAYQPGFLRVILSDCQSLELVKPQVISSQNSKISFDQNFSQVTKYILNDYKQVPNIIKEKEFIKNIYLLQFKEPGLLIFNVIMNKNTIQEYQWMDNNNIFMKKNFFDLITQFIPEKKSLVLKDYVDFIDPKSHVAPQVINYKFINHNKNLQINVAVPQFKDQLIIDFPKTKLIRYNFKFYLLKDNGYDIEQTFKQCGNEVLENQKVAMITSERILPYTSTRNHYTLAISFDEKQLQQVKSQQFLTVFIDMEITLLKDELDYFGITLDEQYSHVPYGVIKIINEDYTSNFILKFIGLLIVIVFIFCLWYQWKLQKRQIEEDIIYIKPNINNQNNSESQDKIEVAQVNEEIYEL